MLFVMIALLPDLDGMMTWLTRLAKSHTTSRIKNETETSFEQCCHIPICRIIKNRIRLDSIAKFDAEYEKLENNDCLGADIFPDENSLLAREISTR